MIEDIRHYERAARSELIIKSQADLCPPFTVNHIIHQQLTTSLARTEEPLQMLEMLAMFRKVQPQLWPQLQPHL